MGANGKSADRLEIDDSVEALEIALRKGLEPDLCDFLPRYDDPLYVAILQELICVEMEYRSNSDNPTTLDDYRQRFSQLFLNDGALQAIAFEEYRQRRERGEKPSPAEYTLRYGVNTARWPKKTSHAHFPANLPRI